MICTLCGADIERRLVGGLVVYRHLSKAQRRKGDHVPKPRQGHETGETPAQRQPRALPRSSEPVRTLPGNRVGSGDR